MGSKLFSKSFWIFYIKFWSGLCDFWVNSCNPTRAKSHFGQFFLWNLSPVGSYPTSLGRYDAKFNLDILIIRTICICDILCISDRWLNIANWILHCSYWLKSPFLGEISAAEIHHVYFGKSMFKPLYFNLREFQNKKNQNFDLKKKFQTQIFNNFSHLCWNSIRIYFCLICEMNLLVTNLICWRFYFELCQQLNRFESFLPLASRSKFCHQFHTVTNTTVTSIHSYNYF